MNKAERALERLNDEFATGNSYSLSQWDWQEYHQKVNRLKEIIKKYCKHELVWEDDWRICTKCPYQERVTSEH